LLIHGENRKCQREIKRSAFLTNVGGRQVDNHFLCWKQKAAGANRRIHAFSGFQDRTIGQTDDMDGWVRGRDADDFHTHNVSVDPTHRR